MKSEFKDQLALPAELIGETARAVGFLSRIPVPDQFFAEDDGPLSQTARVFPLAGVVVALPAAVLFAVLIAVGAPSLLAGLLVVALQIAVTGGLHEDGLADTADGQGAGKDRERMLSIMKDSRIGTYGTLSLVLSIGIRAAAVGAIGVGASPLQGFFALLGLAAASRAAMAWHWQALPAARTDGVAAGAGQPDDPAMNWAIGSGVALLVICLVPAFGVLAGSSALAAVAVATAVFTRHIGLRLDGHTGDTIGAAQQIAETAGLVALALFL